MNDKEAICENCTHFWRGQCRHESAPEFAPTCADHCCIDYEETGDAVKIELLQMPKAEGLPVPRPSHQGDAGVDIVCAEDTDIYTTRVVIVPTGIKVAIPPGYEGQVRPRSGLAMAGLIIPNAPGTIDSGYRGEVGVLMARLHEGAPKVVERGERIAQLVVAPVASPEWEIVDDLSDTPRGEGGFGSTGM